MTLRQRRRALMGAMKKKNRIALVDGTYESTTTVTNGNHLNMNPLQFAKLTKIPLTEPVEVKQSVGVMFSNSFQVNTAIFIYWVGGTRNQFGAANRPVGGVWYESAMEGTMEILCLFSNGQNNINDCDISLKIDGEVLF